MTLSILIGRKLKELMLHTIPEGHDDLIEWWLGDKEIRDRLMWETGVGIEFSSKDLDNWISYKMEHHEDNDEEEVAKLNELLPILKYSTERSNSHYAYIRR